MFQPLNKFFINILSQQPSEAMLLLSLFYRWRTGDRQVAYPRSHLQQVVELGFKSRPSFSSEGNALFALQKEEISICLQISNRSWHLFKFIIIVLLAFHKIIVLGHQKAGVQLEVTCTLAGTPALPTGEDYFVYLFKEKE